MTGKFELKCGAELHNFFEIELISDGEVKQKGFAQNIVLNQFFEKTSIYNEIQVGTGTGVLEPTRTNLFEWAGKKSTTKERGLEDFEKNGVERLTMKAIFNPDELVGKNITEVGVGIQYGGLITHALIKDAEGNPLSIHKTATDKLVIKATLFARWTSPSGVYFKQGNNSEFYSWFSYSSVYAKDRIDTYGKSAEGTRTGNNALTKTAYRFGTSEANFEIRYLGMYNFFIQLSELENFQGIDIIKKSLGKGDGTKTSFEIPNSEPQNIKVYKNGISLTDSEYSIVEKDNYTRDSILLKEIILKFANYRYENVYSRYKPTYFIQSSETLIYRLTPWSHYLIPNLIALMHVPSSGQVQMSDYKLLSDYDTEVSFYGAGESMLAGGQWYNIINGKFVECAKENALSSVPLVSNISGNEYVTPTHKFKDNGIEVNYKKKDIVFNTPPLESDEITVDYHVDYIPKDSEHVLDIGFNISLSAGVPS